MRAAVLHGKEDLRVTEIAPAEVKPGEVRVAIGAALTCGTDLKVYKRGYHARMIVPPAVFGHEMAGTVCEVHPETTGWAVGDRVMVANSAPCGSCAFCARGQENLCDDLHFLNGAYAESIVVPARFAAHNMVRIKPETPFRDAAMTEPLACVVQGVLDLQPRRGDRMLVIGAGPIGLMFAVLGRHFECGVTVAGRGEERLRLARKFGAEAISLPDAADRKFDLVVEAVGQPELWEAAVQLVRKGGAVNFFGGCPSGTSVHLDTGLIHYSNLRLLASFHHRPRTIRMALQFIESGVVPAREFVTGECTLEELPELFAGMARGNRAVKTLVTPGR